jgi:hypothetical protein
MDKRIIEINGVKLEVDLTEATVIDHYKVGDPVKCLIKRYGSSYESVPGVIVGFDAFKKLPTIIVAYLEGGSAVKFLHLNESSEDVEITAMNAKDLPFEKSRVLDLMDREITKAETTVADLKHKKQFFLNEFGKYFERAAVDPDGDSSDVFAN